MVGRLHGPIGVHAPIGGIELRHPLRIHERRKGGADSYRVTLPIRQDMYDAAARMVRALGYTGVADVRQGKFFELNVNAASPDQAKKLASEVADKVLANPVIESYRVEVE